MRRRALVAALASAWAFEAIAADGGIRPALIAVAASVQGAMEEIAAAWTRATGFQLSLSYGSSGNFVRQIQQGLPAELFLSADEDFALKLLELGLARDRGVIYASGRLALFVAKDSPIALDPQLRGLKEGWGGVRKFAIANPELAPYGRAAREVLQSAGLWEQAQAKLVLGESIAQATQFVATGAAQAGITALSTLLQSEAGRTGRFIALPDDVHAPLRQRMVLTKKAGPAATALYAYLQTEAAKAVLRRHGFTAG
jgi:molybdate transport system substrate-binding protein